MQEDPHKAPADATTHTVLIVDDTDSIRRMYARALQRAGFNVIEATDGAHAIRIATEQDTIHLLVTDCLMPCVNGIQLANWFGQFRPDAKCLLMSSSPDALAEAVHARPDLPVMFKTSHPEELIELIQRALS